MSSRTVPGSLLPRKLRSSQHSRGHQTIVRMAIPIVAALLWSIAMLIEMGSLDALARPATDIAAVPTRAVGDLGYDLNADSGCILTPEHAESWIRIPDRRGGTVYQEKQADPETPAEPIWWDPATGPSRILVSAGDGTVVQPYTVSGTPDNTSLWMTRATRADSPTDYTVDLYRVDLDSGEETLVVADIGGFETQPLLVSVSAGGVLVSNSDSTGSWFELYDRDGSPVAWPANPHPVSDYTMKTVFGSLDEDGRHVASIEAEDGDPWRVVVRDRISGRELSSRLLPLQIWRVLHADTSSAGFSFLVETADGEVVCISVPRPTGANGH